MAPENLNQAVIDFLDSVKSAKRLTPCEDCGGVREYRKTTFFYDGKSWQVELPVCPRCSPVSNIPAHDA
jgi:hypothetical protein